MTDFIHEAPHKNGVKTLHTAPIGTLLSPCQLVGARVQYHHFDDLHYSETYTGIVLDAKEHPAYGTQVRIKPDAVTGFSLLTKWRSLRDVEGFAWYVSAQPVLLLPARVESSLKAGA